MKNKFRINFKIALGLGAFLVLLCFVWFLLMGRMNLLLRDNMEQQVAAQMEMAATQLEDKLQIELLRLQNISGFLSESLEGTENAGDILADINQVLRVGETGLLALDGTALYGKSLEFSEFSGIKESFRGNASVCYKEDAGFLFTVPVYKGSNIKYVIYSFYNIEDFRERYQISCYPEGKLLLTEMGAEAKDTILMQEWTEEELERLFGTIYAEGLEVLDKKLYAAKSAAIYQNGGDVPCFLAVAEVGQYNLYLVGIVEESIVAADLPVVSKLVFWVFGLLILLFAIGVIYLLGIEGKAKESDALREAKAVAEQANQAKSDFLANMSHEIRTPINAVMGMNEMILRECQTDAVRGYALNIQSASQNLLGIINDILDFSKIESGKMELVKEDYQLSTLINDVVTMTQIKAEQKGLDLIIDVEESLPEVLYGDEGRIVQIMLNLLNNAVKYTKKGSVTLKVEGIRESNEFSLRIEVKDTGIGIKEQDIGRLFQDFERLDLKENRNVEGTGLGLAITRNLVEMMQGTLEVSSVYQKGSTFTVQLPQIVKKEEPIGNFKQRFEKVKEQRSSYQESFTAKDARVLVVDDNEMNLVVVTNLLKKTEMQIVTCLSGAECLKLLTETHFDIVLLDHMMPTMDGVETLQRAKQLPDSLCKETPFIALTANAIDGVREKYLEAGFDDYLSKPVSGKTLEKMVLKYLPEQLVCQKQEVQQESLILKEEQVKADVLAEEGLEKKESLLNTTLGLSYSCESEELYRQLLGIFTETYEEKKKQLETAYYDSDWKNYTVYVHGLKSTSLNLGGETLSELAKQLEMAGKAVQKEEETDKNLQFIAEHQEALLALFEQTVAEAEEYLHPVEPVFETKLPESQERLKQEVNKQTQQAEERLRRLERLSQQIINALAETIDAKDTYTNGHSLRVAKYSVEIAKRAGKSEKEQEHLYYTGMLHDIGKIGIPDSIITKNSSLSDKEYFVTRKHPEIGAEILETISEIPDLSVGARWHHERYDGTGYPDGRKGTDIPEEARIIAVADAYDAMASRRCYRDVLPQQTVYEEIKKGKGTQFDPVFADIMLQMIEEDKSYNMREK